MIKHIMKSEEMLIITIYARLMKEFSYIGNNLIDSDSNTCLIIDYLI